MIYISQNEYPDIDEITEMFEQLNDNECRDITKNKGYVVHSFYCAMWALKKIGEVSDITYSKLIDQIIRWGGDTDTNAAIAGAIIGAFHGYEARVDPRPNAEGSGWTGRGFGRSTCVAHGPRPPRLGRKALSGDTQRTWLGHQKETRLVGNSVLSVPHSLSPVPGRTGNGRG